jgi:hypothetical protein
LPGTASADVRCYSNHLHPASPFNPIAFTRSALRLAIVLLLITPVLAAKEHYGQGLEVDLDAPYEKALKAVQQVAENGVIQGTWQYRGTSELEGASSAKDAPGFKPWSGKGAVFYKLRPETIAPEHFYGSGDKGTVAVRYIVEPGGPQVTHLRIDAIYREDDGHQSHPSDGQVENSEFAVVSKQLEDIDELERKQRQAVTEKTEERQLEELQVQLQQENAALKSATIRQHELEQQVRELQGIRSATVRTAGANLKSSPYNQSRTIQSLQQGEAVIVLLQTPSWYRVQTANGEQGWVYRLMLTVTP